MNEMRENSIELMGVFSGRRFEDKEVLREMERKDPIGELVARKNAMLRVLKEGLPKSFELVDAFAAGNTVADAYYDLVFDSMLRGDAYTANVRAGVFNNNVTPSATLLISTFRATLGEVTAYTVDGGNATNRSTTTFASSATQSITTAAVPSRFTFTATDTIYGAFITQGATLKDGTQDVAPAVYVAGARFITSQPVANASIIDVVYTQSKA